MGKTERERERERYIEEKEGQQRREYRKKNNIKIRCNTTAIYHSRHVASFYHIKKQNKKNIIISFCMGEYPDSWILTNLTRYFFGANLF